jgi:adenylyltransferase/sulfurtransferase
VLGAMAGTIGAVQAGEALRILRGETPLLAGAILVYDAMGASARRLTVPRNPACLACGAAR